MYNYIITHAQKNWDLQSNHVSSIKAKLIVLLIIAYLKVLESNLNVFFFIEKSILYAKITVSQKHFVSKPSI